MSEARKTGREYPDPVPEGSEVLVDIEKRALLKADPSERQETYRFAHARSKLLFFLLKEGPGLTWRKVKASWLQRGIAAKRAVVFIIGETGGRSVAAVGPMDLPDAHLAAVHRDHVAPLPQGRDADWGLNALLDHLEANPKILQDLYHYSPFSGLGPAVNLERVFADAEKRPSDTGQKPAKFSTPTVPAARTDAQAVSGRSGPGLFLVGAGSYTYSYVIPFLSGLRRDTVIDLNPLLAARMRDRFGFEHADTSCGRAFERLREAEDPVVVIATYHSTHVDVAEAALEANPKARIFMEKPPVTSLSQLERLLGMRKHGAFIEIGYNRRHTRFIRQAKKAIEARQGPLTMTCIVREKNLPLTHWYYWPTQGTRVAGNLSHWIDLGVLFIREEPLEMNLMSSSARFPADEAVVSVNFKGGSQLNLVATDRGNPLRGVQEYIEIRRDETTVGIDDFLRLTVQSGGRRRQSRSFLRDKGHKAMYIDFLEKCQKGGTPSYPDGDLEISSIMYLEMAEALMRGEKTRDCRAVKDLGPKN